MAKLLAEMKRLEQMKERLTHLYLIEESAGKTIHKELSLDDAREDIRDLEQRIEEALINTEI